MPRITYSAAERDAWYVGLPGVVVAAGALITDPAGRVLLVQANYRDHWTVPGGICEPGEPPQAGCRREVAEETGLAVGPGPLLAVDWTMPFGDQQRPMMHFIFDGGTVPDGSGIVLQEEELEAWRLATAQECPGYMDEGSLGRLRAALAGRAAGATVYRPGSGQDQPLS